MQNEELLQLLEDHSGEFAGIVWRPRDLLEPSTIVRVFRIAEALYFEVEELPLQNLVKGGRLKKELNQMFWSLMAAKKARSMNHVEFFVAVAGVFKHGNAILSGVHQSQMRGELQSGG